MKNYRLNYPFLFLIAIMCFSAPGSDAETNPLAARDSSPFADNYTLEKIIYKPGIRPYDLPLKLDSISNWQSTITNLFPEFANAADLIANQGFAAIPSGRFDDFSDACKWLKDRGVPIFISADMALHLYHIQFDETLRSIEEAHFYSDFLAIIQVLEKNLAAPPESPALESSRALAHEYLTLIASCLDPSIRTNASETVLLEIQLIDKHAGFADSPLFSYSEDYSQYVPRGHYTKSETLKRYFIGMMAAGRFSFLLRGGEPFGPGAQFLVSAAEAKRQTLAALLIAESLQKSRLPDGRNTLDVWKRIYSVTSFYTGLADDPGPEDYWAVAAGLKTQSFESLADDPDAFEALCTQLERLAPPAIYSGTGNAGTADSETVSGKPAPKALDKTLDKTMGMRLMGQRFVPDSYFMGRLVFPVVGGEPKSGHPFTAEKTQQGLRRCWPRGLDVMATLGFKRADVWLKKLNDSAYDGYEAERKRLDKEITELKPGDWRRNAYWSWLAALRTLAAPLGPGFQPFQQQPAWMDKTLNACLASWAQLRHDTILYAKQSYTMMAMSARPQPNRDVAGYVEPHPDFFNEILALARMTRNTLDEFKIMSPQGLNKMLQLEDILQRLRDISLIEITGKPLTDDDSAFIRSIGAQMSTLIEGSYQMQESQDPGALRNEFQVEKKTTLVADVHTDSNTSKVLEEATGKLDWLAACIALPDGSVTVCVGPVLSHYEFKQPMSERLTDETWREMLQTPGQTPIRGEWTQTYFLQPTAVAP